MLMLQAKKNRDHPGKRLIIQAVSVVGALGRPQLTAACLASPLKTRGSQIRRPGQRPPRERPPGLSSLYLGT